MYKMSVSGLHDDDEFDLLLGEIPHATSAGNIRELGYRGSSQNLSAIPLSEKTIMHPKNIDNYYQGSQSQLTSVDALSRSPVFGSYVSSSSCPPFSNRLNMSNVYNHMTQKEDSLEGVKSNVYNHMTQKEDRLEGVKSICKQQGSSPLQCIDRDLSRLHLDSKLPDDQSLASAFSVSFNSRNNMSLTSDSAQLYMGFLKSNFLDEGQYRDQVGNQRSNVEVVVDSLPLLPNRIANSLNFGNSSFNGKNMVNVHGMGFPSVAGPGNLDTFSYDAQREEDHAKIFESSIENVKKCTFAERMINLEGERHALPTPSGLTLLSTGIEPFQVLPREPISRMDFPAHSCQQGSYLDPEGSQFFPSQPYGHLNSMLSRQLNNNHMLCEHEDRYMALKQPFGFLQNLPKQGNLSRDQVCLNSSEISDPLIGKSIQPYHLLPASFIEHAKEDGYWNDNVIFQRFNQLNAMQVGCICQCHSPGSCITEENCPFVHEQGRSPRSVWSCTSHRFCENDMKSLGKEKEQISLKNILPRSQGLNLLKSLNPNFIFTNKIHSLGNANANRRVFSDEYYNHHPSGPDAALLPVGARNYGGSFPDDSEIFPPRSTGQLKYTTLDEIEGKIYNLAKDQHGCRYLQDKFVSGNSDDVEKIFVEIIDNMVDLMKDPFGNYLVQKLLDVCDEDQKIHIIHVITRTPGDIIHVSCNMHGTRSMQKVIETLRTPEQVMLVVSALKDGVVKLMKDMNGNHVIQRCLLCLDSEYNEFLFDACALHCVEIATHRNGCCVLQKCLQCSDGKPRERLINAIAANSLHLSQDPFGNYVVQYVCDLKLKWATSRIIEKLQGHFVDLSKQKCSSNVVEKCLKSGGQVEQSCIIQELLESPLDQLLQDPFANYVVQSALDASKGSTARAVFAEAIRPHLPSLRNSPYGKKIISSVNSRNK